MAWQAQYHHPRMILDNFFSLQSEDRMRGQPSSLTGTCLTSRSALINSSSNSERERFLGEGGESKASMVVDAVMNILSIFGRRLEHEVNFGFSVCNIL